MLPVTRFLADLLGSDTRHDVVHQLAEQLEKQGTPVRMHKLYRLLDQGRCSTRLAERIKGVLGDEHASAFDAALDESQPRPPGLNAAAVAPEYPFLWILHERSRPQPIFVVAFTGIVRWKVLDLPAHTARQSLAVQRRIVRTRVGEHLGPEGARWSPFGAVEGFVYVPDEQRSYRVGATGRFESVDLGPFEMPNVGASLRPR